MQAEGLHIHVGIKGAAEGEAAKKVHRLICMVIEGVPLLHIIFWHAAWLSCLAWLSHVRLQHSRAIIGCAALCTAVGVFQKATNRCIFCLLYPRRCYLERQKLAQHTGKIGCAFWCASCQSGCFLMGPYLYAVQVLLRIGVF